MTDPPPRHQSLCWPLCENLPTVRGAPRAEFFSGIAGVMTLNFND